MLKARIMIGRKKEMKVEKAAFARPAAPAH